MFSSRISPDKNLVTVSTYKPSVFYSSSSSIVTALKGCLKSHSLAVQQQHSVTSLSGAPELPSAVLFPNPQSFLPVLQRTAMIHQSSATTGHCSADLRGWRAKQSSFKGPLKASRKLNTGTQKYSLFHQAVRTSTKANHFLYKAE